MVYSKIFELSDPFFSTTKEKTLLQKEHCELESKFQAEHEALLESKAEVQALRERSDLFATDLSHLL